jgi:cell division protein FtsQ
VKKEGKAWRRRAIAAAVVGGGLITAAISILYIPSLSPLDLREVSISGNRRAAASEIVSLSGLSRGQPLLAISLRRTAERIRQHPWVRDVRVSRSFPHGLRIAIEERQPIAWMASPTDGDCLLLGEEGVIVSADCAESRPAIELRGAAAGGYAPGARLIDPRVTELLESLLAPDLQSLHLSCLNVSNLASIELLAEDDLRVLLGGIEGVEERVEELTALGRRIDFRDYEQIDLRFGGEATLVPRKAVRR